MYMLASVITLYVKVNLWAEDCVVHHLQKCLYAFTKINCISDEFIPTGADSWLQKNASFVHHQFQLSRVTCRTKIDRRGS